MSGEVVGALIGAGSALGGVALTQVANIVLGRQQESASYRVNLYPKRLEVHQQAYKWLFELILPLRAVMESGPEDSDIALRKSHLLELSDKARSWWDANCLYLDQRSRSEVVDFIEACRARGEDTFIPDLLNERQMYLHALTAVQQGIGMRHLDVPEPRR